MPLRLVLEVPELTGGPGEQVGTAARMRNTTGRTETFHFELLGPAFQWGHISPETATVGAGADVVVETTLTLPEAESRTSGWFPWGVRAANGDGSRAAVAEGGVTVEDVEAVALDVIPDHIHGRWSGRYVLTIGNRGNQPGRWRLSGVDESDQVSFAFGRTIVELEPGAETIVGARVRTRRPTLFGRMTNLAFGFKLESAGDSARGEAVANAEATLEQLAILSIKPPHRPGLPSTPKPRKAPSPLKRPKTSLH